MQQLFVFGLGYSTAGLARQAQKEGWVVTSTSRQPARFQRIASCSHRILHFDPAGRHPLDDKGVAALREASYVVTSIPPVAARLYDPVLTAQHRLLRQLLDAAGGHRLECMGYLSSTGVYGDWGGAWVDESSDTRSATARGVLRLEAEQAWAALSRELQVPLTVFRLGGIYGPERSVLTTLQAQEHAGSSTARRRSQRFTSRCHVADVAQALLADMRRRTQQQQQQSQVLAPSQLVDVINVVDDEPAPRGDVEAYALELLLASRVGHGGGAGAASPRGAAPAEARSPAAAAATTSGRGGGGSAAEAAARGPAGAGEEGRAAAGAAAEGPRQPAEQQQQQQQQQRRRRPTAPLEEKRVRNAKLKTLLRQQPQAGLVAPTYREGLAMLVGGDLQPFDAADLECLYGGSP